MQIKLVVGSRGSKKKKKKKWSMRSLSQSVASTHLIKDYAIWNHNDWTLILSFGRLWSDLEIVGFKKFLWQPNWTRPYFDSTRIFFFIQSFLNWTACSFITYANASYMCPGTLDTSSVVDISFVRHRVILQLSKLKSAFWCWS